MVSWKLVEKRVYRVSKKFMEYDGRVVNHSRVNPLRVVRKALHRTTSSNVYKLTW